MPETPSEFAWDGLALLVVGGIIGLFLRNSTDVVGSGGHTAGTVVLWVAGVAGLALLVIAGISKAVQVGVRSSRD